MSLVEPKHIIQKMRLIIIERLDDLRWVQSSSFEKLQRLDMATKNQVRRAFDIIKCNMFLFNALRNRNSGITLEALKALHLLIHSTIKRISPCFSLQKFGGKTLQSGMIVVHSYLKAVGDHYNCLRIENLRTSSKAEDKVTSCLDPILANNKNRDIHLNDKTTYICLYINTKHKNRLIAKPLMQILENHTKEYFTARMNMFRECLKQQYIQDVDCHNARGLASNQVANKQIQSLETPFLFIHNYMDSGVIVGTPYSAASRVRKHKRAFTRQVYRDRQELHEKSQSLENMPPINETSELNHTQDKLYAIPKHLFRKPVKQSLSKPVNYSFLDSNMSGSLFINKQNISEVRPNPPSCKNGRWNQEPQRYHEADVCRTSFSRNQSSSNTSSMKGLCCMITNNSKFSAKTEFTKYMDSPSKLTKTEKAESLKPRIQLNFNSRKTNSHNLPQLEDPERVSLQSREVRTLTKTVLKLYQGMELDEAHIIKLLKGRSKSISDLLEWSKRRNLYLSKCSSDNSSYVLTGP